MRFYLHEMSGIGRSTATECRLPVARGWQKGGMGMTAHGYESPLGVMKMFWHFVMLTVAQQRECVNATELYELTRRIIC